MRAFGRTISIAAVLMSLAGMAAAADIRVLSVGAVQNAVRPLAADFAKETGHKIVFTVGSPAVVTQKIKDGEMYDAVIVSEPAMDRLDKEGIVNPESRVRLANTGIGVAVRAGAPAAEPRRPPTRSGRRCWRRSRSSTAIRRCPTRAAKRRNRSWPRHGHSRRAQAEAADRSRASREPGLIAKGEVEMGLYNLSEIPEGKGLKIAGPVPAPLQLATTYEGALMSDGAVPEASRAFIRFLSEPEARAKWLAAKLEPLADHWSHRHARDHTFGAACARRQP